MEPYLGKIASISNETGTLGVLSSSHLPFEVKRIYFLSGVPDGAVRGHHAHKELIQVMWAVGGNISLTLDNGVKRNNFELTNSENFILVPPGLWREIHHFSPNSVLMVAASKDYDEDDYIRNYEDFLLWRKLK